MKKIVIYFAGGTMRGVFGAGVAKAFEEENLYSHIRAIYGASAGVMTGAYFLACQTGLGASIYWEDLGENFISKKKFFIGVWQRFQNRFIKKVPSEKIQDALNIDFLMDIVTNKKILNTEKLAKQEIPLFVKLFNLDSHVIEYIDARGEKALEILKAGINVFPYVHEVTYIHDRAYIDAAIMDIVGWEILRERHPEDKIVVIMNGDLDRKRRYRWKNKLEGKFMEWMFNDPHLYLPYATAEDKLRKDIQLIKSDPNSILITDTHAAKVRSRTTDANLLKNTYLQGIETGRNLAKIIKDELATQ